MGTYDLPGTLVLKATIGIFAMTLSFTWVKQPKHQATLLITAVKPPILNVEIENVG